MNVKKKCQAVKGANKMRIIFINLEKEFVSIAINVDSTIVRFIIAVVAIVVVVVVVLIVLSFRLF